MIDKYLPFIGGAELQAQLLAGLLSARLWCCDVFTAQSDARSDAAETGLHRLGTSRRTCWRNPINFLAGFLEFLIHGHRYSVVHGHALSALACGAIVGARLRGCATVVKLCSVGPEGDIAKLTRHPLGRWLWPMIRRLAVFVVPAPPLASELLAAGIPADRIAVIPNALPSGVSKPPGVSKTAARAELELPDRPIVLFVGRLSREKGPDVLMRAWDQVAAECDATLVVVGVGAEAERVAQWVRQSGHVDRVRLAGARLDVDRFYRAADVLAVPSRSETFCNALAEGMAHELAVVATPVGLAKHWIWHGQNGMIVGGEDGSEMARALRQLLEDPPLRQRLGAAARRDALANFSADTVAEQYLDLYGRLMAKAGLMVVA